MTHSHCSDAPLSSRAPQRDWAHRLLARYFAAISLRKQHRALLAMDAHLLNDIGITRAQAVEQAEKPVWSAPTHWKR